MNDIEIAGIVLNSLAIASVFVIAVAMIHIYIYGVKDSWLSKHFVKLEKPNQVYFKHVLVFIFQFIFLVIGTTLCVIK
jgi:hypothetical protein